MTAHHFPPTLLFLIEVSGVRDPPLALALVGRLLNPSFVDERLMLNVCAIDMRGDQRPGQEAESVTKSKLLTEAEVTKQLDRVAPDWPLHLHDSAVIDHILKVINNPRTSRAEITRRYRARRAVAGLVLRGVALQASGKR